jgi:hypothetical protein
MSPSYDYSEFAEECVIWARTAKSPRELAIFRKWRKRGWKPRPLRSSRRGFSSSAKATPCRRTEC